VIFLPTGLAPAHHDPRTLAYSAMRAAGEPFAPPASYSWDGEHPGAVTTPMFANDVHGDCVIAARAHQTLRFEAVELGTAPAITDLDVTTEYFMESGGQDSGLVYLYSLRDWRNKGWIADKRWFGIHSFLSVNYREHDEVRETMIVGSGLQTGVRLPLNAADQMNAGQPWDVEAGPRSAKGSWGGHAILAVAYDVNGVEFVTWGKKQRATWRWLDAYCDECYLVIDDIDRAKTAAPLDALALEAAISHV